jgi:RNA-directed DNA polymerase
MNFSLAMSAQAKKAKGKQIRDWHLNRRSGTDLSGIARAIKMPWSAAGSTTTEPSIAPKLHFIAWRIDQHLVRWAMQKFKRLRWKPQLARDRLREEQQRNPRLFAHWHLLPATPNRPARAG